MAHSLLQFHLPAILSINDKKKYGMKFISSLLSLIMAGAAHNVHDEAKEGWSQYGQDRQEVFEDLASLRHDCI